MINDKKPRMGCFVVTLNGKKIIELLDMTNPFDELKAMDVEGVTQASLKN